MKAVGIIIFLFTYVFGVQAIYHDMGTDDNICERTITRLVSHLVYLNKKKVVCNADRTHCTTTYSIVSEIRYRTETRTVHECCEGFVMVDGVCTREEMTTVGETSMLTGSKLSPSMLTGIVSAVVFVILILVAVITVICVLKRKPKLYYLMRRTKKNPKIEDADYAEASDYTQGYMEPIKTGEAPVIGNAMYKGETIGKRREQNAYTDLRFENGKKFHDDYTKLHEQKSPPVQTITQFFEGKNENQSSSKPEVHSKKRTNTSPVKKIYLSKETRSNSTPSININEKDNNKTNTEKNQVHLSQKVKTDVSANNTDTTEKGPGVKSLLRKMESLSSEQASTNTSLLSTSSATLPKPKPRRKATSITTPSNQNQTFEKVNKKQNTLPRTAQRNTGKNTIQFSSKPTISAKTPNIRSQGSLITKKEELHNQKQQKSKSRIEMSDEPPAYDDVHFYDYIK